MLCDLILPRLLIKKHPPQTDPVGLNNLKTGNYSLLPVKMQIKYLGGITLIHK
jgi:hypothetical protein